MPNPRNNAALTLRIITPDEPMREIPCDAIRLTVKDDANGRGGGLYGIHPGHAPALIALECGELTAAANGETVLRAVTGEGFARVERDRVTVTAESVSIAAEK